MQVKRKVAFALDGEGLVGGEDVIPLPSRADLLESSCGQNKRQRSDFLGRQMGTRPPNTHPCAGQAPAPPRSMYPGSPVPSAGQRWHRTPQALPTLQQQSWRVRRVVRGCWHWCSGLTMRKHRLFSSGLSAAGPEHIMDNWVQRCSPSFPATGDIACPAQAKLSPVPPYDPESR